MERIPLKRVRQNKPIQSLYFRAEIEKCIWLLNTHIDENLNQTLEDYIKTTIEGKCIVEGFVKHNSTKIKTFSSGKIVEGTHVAFDVVFECDICNPPNGMLIHCVAKNITLAGISGESANDINSPINVLVPKDYHVNKNNDYFNEIKVGDKFYIKVIACLFQLKDTHVSILGELKKPEHGF
jgi:DNA-directed RNA polymerase subunit E'/Rpb7